MAIGDAADGDSAQGSSCVPSFVHGPHFAMRTIVFAPPFSNPYLRMASWPYQEQVGVKRH